MIPVLVPLFVSAFQGGQTKLALAMEAGTEGQQGQNEDERAQVLIF